MLWRGGSGQSLFVRQNVEGLDEQLHLESVDLTAPLSVFYRKVEFDHQTIAEAWLVG